VRPTFIQNSQYTAFDFFQGLKVVHTRIWRFL